MELRIAALRIDQATSIKVLTYAAQPPVSPAQVRLRSDDPAEAGGALGELGIEGAERKTFASREPDVDGVCPAQFRGDRNVLHRSRALGTDRDNSMWWAGQGVQKRTELAPCDTGTSHCPSHFDPERRGDAELVRSGHHARDAGGGRGMVGLGGSRCSDGDRGV